MRHRRYLGLFVAIPTVVFEQGGAGEMRPDGTATAGGATLSFVTRVVKR
jgi:hypothetical protein